ncbi:MAG TPA: Clp protease N-terminal domain-containing protein [Bryobacteraceae bacterium]|nr:Clp protease N-terminal domain-containing protein [Bryobacteraceae bacterium]
MSGASKRVLAYAADEALRLEHKNVTPLHLIAGLLREEKSRAAKLLRQEITIEQVRAKLQYSAGTRGETTPEPRPDSVLAQTCRDLTAAVEGHPFPALVGRDRELNTVIQVLAKRNGNNPVLIGEPGVGKTAIIEGLAQRMVNRQVPEFLAAKRLLVLNSESFMEGPRNRRIWRDQFAALLEEIAEDSNVILVIDGLFEPAAQAGGPFAGVLGALLASLAFGTLQRLRSERRLYIVRPFRKIRPSSATCAVLRFSRRMKRMPSKFSLESNRATRNITA